MSDLEQPPRCVICRKLATHFGVHTERSFFDRIWFLAWMKRVMATPPRFVVEENTFGGKIYCLAHQKDAVAIYEALLAKTCAEHAALNAAQQNEISALEHGGLDEELRTRFAGYLERYGLLEKPSAVSQPKQLEAAPQSNVHVMPVASTGGE